jgi:hypothetical protein
MVIQAANVRREVATATRGCAGVTRGGVSRCMLRAGHDGHHFTRVEVRRPSGAVVGFALQWIDTPESR